MSVIYVCPVVFTCDLCGSQAATQLKGTEPVAAPHGWLVFRGAFHICRNCANSIYRQVSEIREGHQS